MKGAGALRQVSAYKFRSVVCLRAMRSVNLRSALCDSMELILYLYITVGASCGVHWWF